MNSAADRAGYFGSPDGAGSWVWRGKELFDARGHLIADVRADVLRVDQHRLLLERSPERMTFGLRGTAVDGTVYLIEQSSFTLAHLSADCQGRVYELWRAKPWRKDRIVTDQRSGKRVVRIRPRMDGTVEVEDGPDIDSFPVLDVVFLSYACTLVDAPGSNLRI